MATTGSSSDNQAENNPISNLPLITSSSSLSTIPHCPHQVALSKPNPTKVLMQQIAPIQLVLDNFHKTAEKWLNALHFSAAQNPFLSSLLSLSSHVQHFSQGQWRSNRSFNHISNHNFAAVLPGDSVAGLVVANGISNFLNIYNTVLVVRLVLTWFPNTPQQIVSPLSTICDPYLNIFRGIIPPLGGTLDLSPILAFLVLNAFTSAAAAIPAELPSATSSHERANQTGLSDLTSSMNKWKKRLEGSRSTKTSV